MGDHALLVHSRTELAELLGVHPDRVTKYVMAGMPVVKQGSRGHESTFDVAACLAWHRQQHGDRKTREAEQTRYYKAQADKTELDNAKRRGELLETADVERVWATHMVEFREWALSLPSTARARGYCDAAGEAGIRELVDQVLAGLAGDEKSPYKASVVAATASHDAFSVETDTSSRPAGRNARKGRFR